MKELKIRLPEELKQKLADRAADNDRSMAAEVLNILKAAVLSERLAGARNCTGSNYGETNLPRSNAEPA